MLLSSLNKIGILSTLIYIFPKPDIYNGFYIVILHFFQHCDKILAFFLGWAGAALILMFTVNAAFIGSRLGLCWVILEERYEEFRREIRDPYPSIGEKAVGRWGR